MARVFLLACALALVACATAMPYQDSCVGSMEFASIDVLTFTRGQSTVPCLTSHARAPQLTARPRPGGLQQVELAYAFCVRSGIGWNCGAVGWTNNYRITAPSVECEPSETTWGAVFPSMCTLTYTADFDVDYKPTTLDMEAQADWNLVHEAAGPVDPSLLHATKYVRDPAVRSKFFPTLATDTHHPVPTEPTERKRYTPEGTKVYEVTAGMRIDPRTLPNPDLLPDGWEAIVDDRGYITFQMTRETFAKSSDPWGVKDLKETRIMTGKGNVVSGGEPTKFLVHGTEDELHSSEQTGQVWGYDDKVRGACDQDTSVTCAIVAWCDDVWERICDAAIAMDVIAGLGAYLSTVVLFVDGLRTDPWFVLTLSLGSWCLAGAPGFWTFVAFVAIWRFCVLAKKTYQRHWNTGGSGPIATGNSNVIVANEPNTVGAPKPPPDTDTPPAEGSSPCDAPPTPQEDTTPQKPKDRAVGYNNEHIPPHPATIIATGGPDDMLLGPCKHWTSDGRRECSCIEEERKGLRVRHPFIRYDSSGNDE